MLSAIEGLEVATPAFDAYIMPITLGILVALFVFQHRGTASVGAVFGPIMLVWFLALAMLGIGGIAQHPACSPRSTRSMPTRSSTCTA